MAFKLTLFPNCIFEVRIYEWEFSVVALIRETIFLLKNSAKMRISGEFMIKDIQYYNKACTNFLILHQMYDENKLLNSHEFLI